MGGSVGESAAGASVAVERRCCSYVARQRQLFAHLKQELQKKSRCLEYVFMIGTERNGTGRDGTGRDGTGRDGTGRDGSEGDGTSRDGTKSDLTGPDRTERNRTKYEGTGRNGMRRA